MDEIKLEIYSEGNHYDYSPWVEEKIHNVIVQLLYTKPENEDNEYCVDSALYDALKIYGACTGRMDTLTDKEVLDFIYQYRRDGFDFVEYCLGLSTRKCDLFYLLEDNASVKRIKSLITPDKSNRTLIHEELAKLHHHNEWTKQISNDVEEVTIGNKSWEWFYSTHCNDDDSECMFSTPEIPKVLYEYLENC